MKPVYALIFGSVLMLVACQPKGGGASRSAEPAVAAAAVVESGGLAISAAQPSPHFEVVMKQLDVGGKSLHYTDHAGQREMWIELLGLIKEMVPDAELFGDFDPESLVDESGLCSAVASGRSLSKDGEHWLVRHYAHHPKGLPEVMGMMGESKEFAMPGLPGTTDVAFEGRLDARALPKMMRRYAGLSAGAEEVEAALKEKLPIGMTVEGVLLQAKADVLLGMELAKTQVDQMPVMPKAFVLKIRTEKSLVAACKVLLGKAMGDAKPIAGLSGWEIPLPPMPGMEEMKPVLLIEGDDTLVAVSSAEYWDAVKGSGERLGGNAVYQSATNHFPKAGNVQVYLSPMVATAVRGWAEMAMKDSQEFAGMKDVLKKITPGKPWSVCVACGKTGIQTIAEMPFAMDASATTAMVGLSTVSTLFVGARSWSRGSDRAACIINIRNVQQAVRGHANMNSLEIGTTIDWDDIFGADGYLKEPKCPEGGTYTFAKTIPAVGVLVCTCSHGDTEKRHKPDNHEDW